MDAVDPGLVEAWLTARSISRGLPWPVPDRGGLRVDSGQLEEQRRYLFVEPGDGLAELGATIDQPFVALKLCRPGAELMRLLPERWGLASDNFMMTCDRPFAPATVPDGYDVTIEQDGPAVVAMVRDGGGDQAAYGRAVEHGGVFILDQIRTEESHQRRGLGTALVGALIAARQSSASRLVLTATHAGRGLYRRLGWLDYCAYATAMIPPRH